MQKAKMLRLMEIFRQETDAEHPLTTNGICKRLLDFDITCDRKTLARDIAQLNEMGFHVVTVRCGHSNAYYVEQREFSRGEIKILMDAVQAAACIPEEQTALLIEKLADLGGSHRADILKGNLVQFNIKKHTNTSIFENVETIESALQEQVKIAFLYFRHDEYGNRVYRHGGETYVVEPISLIYDNDNYYLMCYNPARGEKRNYRIDRMEQVRIVDELISDAALISAQELASYTSKTFRMYGGDEVNAAIEFDDSLIDVVFDQFGKDVKMLRLDENRLIAHVKFQVSRTFWGWLFQFPDQMRIISPPKLAEECRAWAKQVL